MHDLAFLREDLDDMEAASSPADRRGRRMPATETLARLAVEDALGDRPRRRVGRAEALAMVVEVPSAEWVEPVLEACRVLGEWSATFARTGSSRTEDRPDKGNDKVAKVLAQGGRVLGVSHACERHLPAALVAAVDVRIRVSVPSNDVVARVIRSATGQRPPAMPARVAAGLGYWELCSAIRGTSARACVQRLVAAKEAKSVADASGAEAPAFETLCGYGAAHDWGKRLLRDLDLWKRGEIPFRCIDRNVVLASDPGLGKSTYVRSLARASGLPLIVTSVSAWFSSSSGYLDAVIKQIDTEFSHAASLAPSIIFLDEIDSIPNRATMTERAREYWNSIVTHMLLTIDNYTANNAADICIIGATNHADKLDAALVRPGRLNRVIRIEPPRAPDLAVIFRQHLGAELADVDLATLGELALGATGAQVAAWVLEARARARAEERPLRAEDLFGVVAPEDGRSDQERARSALHEAAHAVGAEILRVGRVAQVDLVLRGASAGATSIKPLLGSSPTRDELERMVIFLLCGRAAEAVFLGEASAGAGGDAASDLARATAFVAGIHASLGLGDALAYRGTMEEVARSIRDDPGLRGAVEADLARLQAEAEKLVWRFGEAVQAVAKALLDRRVVGGDALRALMAGHGAGGRATEGKRK
jgi:cell division protease FtsH